MPFKPWLWEPLEDKQARERAAVEEAASYVRPGIESGDDFSLTYAKAKVKETTEAPARQSGGWRDAITSAFKKMQEPKEPSYDVSFEGLDAATQEPLRRAAPGSINWYKERADAGGGGTSVLETLGDIGEGGLQVLNAGQKYVGAPLAGMAANAAQGLYEDPLGTLNQEFNPAEKAKQVLSGDPAAASPLWMRGITETAQGLLGSLAEKTGLPVPDATTRAYKEGGQAYQAFEANPDIPVGAKVAASIATDPLTYIGPGALTKLPKVARLLESPYAATAGAGAFAAGGAQTAETAGLPPWMQTISTLAGGLLGGIAGAKAPAIAKNLPEGVGSLRTAMAAEEGTLTLPGVRAPTPAIRPVGDLRPLDVVKTEVKTLDPGLKRTIASSPVFRWINPSLLENTEIGKTLTAYERNRISAESLKDAAIRSSLDVFEPAGGVRSATGSIAGTIFKIGEDAQITDLAVNPGQSKVWQDVFTRPWEYDLSPQQGKYVETFHTAMEGAADLMERAGIKKFAQNADGSWYVPRKVLTIREIENLKRINPEQARVYELAAEGLANGIKYSDSPRETLDLYLRYAYDKVLNKQLSDALEPLTIKPSALIPKDVTSRVDSAALGRRAAEVKFRADRDRLAELRQTRDEWQFRHGVKPPNAILNQVKDAEVYVDRSRNAMDLAANAHHRAREAYFAASKKAQDQIWGPGYLFGKTDEQIPIAKWRSRFMPREDRELLDKYVGEFGGAIKAKPNALTRSVEFIGNVSRSTAASIDFGAGMIQGLPVLARNPDAWGKMMAAQFKGTANPKFLSQYIADNIDDVQEMARHGVPIQGEEALSGFKDVANLGRHLPEAVKSPIAAVAGQTYGRFSSGYQASLTVARTEIWKAMKGKMHPQQLGEYIRNTTGGLDSRALLVGPNQRAAESMWMAFSPRLLRSTVALAADALNPTSQVGAESLRTLAQLGAGMMAAYYATGKAMGKEDEEIFRGMDPTQGKEFLSYKINGDWIGVGGQIRALTQLIANVATSPPRDWASTSINYPDNPLIEFITNRGAPALNIGRTVMEGATGYNADPYHDISGLPDIAAHLSHNALPFALQGILEGAGPTGAVAGFLGARTSPETPTEQIMAEAVKRREAGERLFRDYTGQVSSAQRSAIFKAHPELREAWESTRTGRTKEAIGIRNEIAAKQTASDEKLQAGQMTKDGWKSLFNENRKEQFYRIKQLYSGTDGKISTGDPVLDSYYAVIDDAKDEKTGAIEWDAVDEYKATLSKDDREYIDEYTGVTDSPIGKAYKAAQKLRDEYYALPQYQGYSGADAQKINALYAQVNVEAKRRAPGSPESVKIPVLNQLAQQQGVPQHLIVGVRRKIQGSLSELPTRANWKKLHPEAFVFDNPGPLTDSDRKLMEKLR